LKFNNGPIGRFSEVDMKLKALIAGMILATMSALAASAEDTVHVQLSTYRTGPYAGSGIPIANGMADYLAMLNERDGGVNGVKIVVEECETGYDTQKGVECYERAKAKKSLVFNPYSTGITLAVIPKASVDRMPILSMAYGLSASADGKAFPWVFNPPLTYWDGASGVVKFIAEQEGGMDKLRDKKIGFIYLDAGYGKEPIPLFEQFAAKYGYTLLKYPVPGKEMQNQSSQWLNIRRDKPDYMVMWGWGAMNPTAVKEATKIRFPMEKFIGIWWSGGEDDARGGGAQAKGYTTLNFHAVGADFPLMQDIKKHVVDAGKSKVDTAKFGENLYNRGVVNSLYIAEAIRTAQEKTGKKVITSEDMRVGLESLNIDDARIEALGAKGLIAPVRVTCDNHSGHHKMYVQRWTGETWEKISDWFDPMSDVVSPMLLAASKSYTETNKPWPARSEPCAN
jgi:branched-chain amino acid transport system substrate-binding protein